MIAGSAGWAGKVWMILALLGAVWILLPDAAPGSTDFTMPTVIVDSLSTVVKLNRYLPIVPIIAIATFELGYRFVMFQLWFWSWVAAKITQ